MGALFAFSAGITHLNQVSSADVAKGAYPEKGDQVDPSPFRASPETQVQ
jgi:hypothetical protein